MAYEDKLCRLRVDRVQVGGGKEISYSYLERAGAVIVVPVTGKGDIILVRQFRYPVGAWCLEVPAGGTHDANGAPLEQIAGKELREEVGATAGSLTHVGFFYSANAFSNEKCHVFLAENTELSGEPQREKGESIETKLVSAAEALQLVRNGAIQTGPCALALLLCEPALRERGYVVASRRISVPATT